MRNLQNILYPTRYFFIVTLSLISTFSHMIFLAIQWTFLPSKILYATFRFLHWPFSASFWIKCIVSFMHLQVPIVIIQVILGSKCAHWIEYVSENLCACMSQRAQQRRDMYMYRVNVWSLFRSIRQFSIHSIVPGFHSIPSCCYVFKNKFTYNFWCMLK